MGAHLLFYFRFDLRKWSWSINEKNSINITVPMLVNSSKSMPFLIFLRTTYSRMSWGCPGMLKSRMRMLKSMDAVSNRWESIRSLFRGYITLSYRDSQVQNFRSRDFQLPKMMANISLSGCPYWYAALNSCWLLKS